MKWEGASDEKRRIRPPHMLDMEEESKVELLADDSVGVTAPEEGPGELVVEVVERGSESRVCEAWKLILCLARAIEGGQRRRTRAGATMSSATQLRWDARNTPLRDGGEAYAPVPKGMSRWWRECLWRE